MTDHERIAAYNVDFIPDIDTYSMTEEERLILLDFLEKGIEPDLFTLTHPDLLSWIACGQICCLKDSEETSKYLDILINVAEKGNTVAMNHLSRICFSMLGLKNDQDLRTLGKKYAEMAARKGCPYGMRNLSCFYLGEKNIELWLAYRLMAVDLGGEYKLRAEDAYRIGKHFGTEGKTSNMIAYYKIAADQYEHIEAIEALASYYEKESKMDDALRYYTRAVEKDSVTSMHHLGRCYKSLKNYTLAQQYLKMGIDKGDVDCVIELARVYVAMGDWVSAEIYYHYALNHFGDYTTFKFLSSNYKEKEEWQKLLHLIYYNRQYYDRWQKDQGIYPTLNHLCICYFKKAFMDGRSLSSETIRIFLSLNLDPIIIPYSERLWLISLQVLLRDAKQAQDQLRIYAWKTSIRNNTTLPYLNDDICRKIIEYL
jgi:TPR repeat protein